MDLAVWADRVLREVSQSGVTVERIRLTSVDGSTWETWYAPFPAPDEWVREAESVLTELLDDWPSQDIQLIFIAEDKPGVILSQCTKRVKGRQKGAQSPFGGPGKALADSMDAQARTMDRILATATGQIDMLSKTLELTQNQNVQLLETMKAMHFREMEMRPTVGPEVLERALESLPDLIKFLVSDGKTAGAN